MPAVPRLSMRGVAALQRATKRPGSRSGRVALPIVAAACIVLVCSGCTSTPGAPPASDPSGAWSTPPAGAVPDYQLGGAYDPVADVGIVGRDRSAEPSPAIYSVCYVNGFQTQPGEFDLWDADLLLHRDGEVVFDPDWPEEALLDTSTPENRERIAAGQKNSAEDAGVLREKVGFDFAVTEECAAYEECGVYTDVYGEAVIDIEYTDELPRSFAEMCADPASPVSMVLRDRDLLTPADEGYVFEPCPR